MAVDWVNRHATGPQLWSIVEDVRGLGRQEEKIEKDEAGEGDIEEGRGGLFGKGKRWLRALGGDKSGNEPISSPTSSPKPDLLSPNSGTPATGRTSEAMGEAVKLMSVVPNNEVLARVTIDAPQQNLALTREGG